MVDCWQCQTAVTHIFDRICRPGVEADWDYGLYDVENPPVDLCIKPPGLRWIGVEAWGRNNNQAKVTNSWKILRNFDMPIMHLFADVDVLAEVLGTINQADLVDLTSDPRDWDGTFNRSHALDLLAEDWTQLAQANSCAGDIVTAGVLDRSEPFEILEQFKQQDSASSSTTTDPPGSLYSIWTLYQ